MKRVPNPNTAYGRRRIIEEQYINRQQNNDGYDDSIKTLIGIIIVIAFIALFIYTRIVPTISSGNYIGPRGGSYHYSKSGKKVYD